MFRAAWKRGAEASRIKTLTGLLVFAFSSNGSFSWPNVLLATNRLMLIVAELSVYCTLTLLLP
ncbi:MAG: hypothetical protein EAY75_10600 [Bacteroidetes bacterium]|nr:MAG: hypothetical protein EAY75_10600 [Bacteroidota bacterium]